MKKLQLLVLLLINGIIITSSCSFWKKPEPIMRDFDILDLLIGLGEMPDGWKIKVGPERFQDVGAFEAAQIAFAVDENMAYNGASLGIYNYGTKRSAEYVFTKIFTPLGKEIPPLEWSKISVPENQYKIGCYNREGREPYYCTWIAQYEEFIVDFSTWIIPSYMSYGDMENVIIAIDQQMKTYLEMPLNIPTN